MSSAESMRAAPTEAPAAISIADFRDVLRHFAAGVTLVTAARDGARHGMTVTAFASVSAEPPLVSVTIDRAHSINPFLAGEGAGFAVNLLAAEQAALSDRFAYAEAGRRFAAGDWGRSAAGAPVLADALAWLDCAVHARVPAGTHTIYLGAVREVRVLRPDAAPLVYWNRGYRSLSGPPDTAPAGGD